MKATLVGKEAASRGNTFSRRVCLSVGQPTELESREKALVNESRAEVRDDREDRKKWDSKEDSV